MSKRMLILMCSIFLIVPLLFMGCGNDGAAGPAGAPGTPGINGDNGAIGPAGPTTTTNESCMVCHTTGRIADISDSDNTSITHYNAAYNYPSLTIDNVAVDNAAGLPKVTFRVRNASDNAAITAIDNANVAFYLSNLVPAGTVAGSTPQFERWAYENATHSWGTFAVVDSASGNYSYTFLTPFDNATVLAPDYTPASIQRLFFRVYPTGYNGAVSFQDFIPADGFPTTSDTGIGYSARQFVTVAACKKCHGPEMWGAAHASSYLDTRACVICHSPIGIYGDEMSTGGIWLGSLVHKIHSAIAIAALPNRLDGQGYTAVRYPQDVRNCETCHTASGQALGAGDNTANWKSHPTAAACGTCHTSANFVTGVGHDGGPQSDTDCHVCHPATGHVLPTVGASVTEAHDTSAAAALHPTPMNVPEFDVTLGTSAPANTTHYVAGEVLAVTATLNYHGGAAVPASVYTTAKDAAAGSAGGGLRVASLYVYGPRAMPKPLLATQATSLFVNAADTHVATDGTGFKYNVTIPDNLVSGTYMVRVRFGDYSRVSDTDYKIESTAIKTIQIGSATVTAKVSGDACVDCHGTGTAPFHDARHSVVFDTDQCVSCHDYSGGHASVIANRVHAVHASNSYGDMLNNLGVINDVDWSDVTWPQNSYNDPVEHPDRTTTFRYGRCVTCHTSGNTSYRSTVHEVTCLGCHGDDPNPATLGGGATNHMLQNGGHYPVALP